MHQFIKTLAFLQHFFSQDRLAAKAAAIIDGILAARSPRLSEIAQHMAGTEAANYKAIQRFLKQVDVKALLVRLFQAEAPFVIGDPTEIPRPQARKTSYVGTLKDGKTLGFWLLVLATPFCGRAIPCGFVTYSSETIAQVCRSRNQYHWEAFDQLKALLGDKPLVLDREFSYLELLEYLVAAELNFVIRLNMGSHSPTFEDADGRKVTLTVSRGEQAVYRQVLYKGQVPVNVVGMWRKDQAEPLWVMSNLAPEQALTLYAARMKIEQSFRDLKNLLGLDRLMNKSQQSMEQVVALVMLAFTIGLLTGETLREALFDHPNQAQAQSHSPQASTPTPPSPYYRKWKLYSGLFIVLKRKITLPDERLQDLLSQAVATFAQLQIGRAHV